MHKVAKVLGMLALVVGLNATMAVVTAPSNANEPAAVEVAEDEPGWNCYTMGNEVCGVDTYVLDGEGHKGAVLPVANDGRVYVAWQDGIVTPANEWQREAAWNTCVDYATGGDASMQACDDDFQNPGDRFTK